MPTIRILPDRVANQIAAGEVVERPAAVVRELVENSLDAGATRVTVEFAHGGRSLMGVEDNGKGMDRDDALLALERHATSKITEATDLDSLHTFGFRGEAVPSIASVSRFEMRTRPAAAETGTEILVNGGKFVHVRDCGMPPGTRITVANLFHPVPARRKFLKSDSTEAAHIIQCVRFYALAHPEVAFTLIEDGRTIFQSPPCRSLLERVAAIFGRQTAEALLPVEAAGEGMRLTGLIGKPGASRGSRHEMITFVNRRPVDTKTLAYALIESYQQHLPKGRYPLAFLFLEIEPASVDVNVHPAKREVRFRNDPGVRTFVVRSLLDALRQAAGDLTATLPPGAQRVTPLEPLPSAIRPPLQSTVPKSAPLPAIILPQPASLAAPLVTEPLARPTPAIAPVLVSSSAAVASAEPLASVPDAIPGEGRPGALAGWRHLGTAHGDCEIFETPAGVVLLDRRAALERVVFEQLQREFRDGHTLSQRLLFAVPVELDPIAAAMLADQLAFLEQHGLEVSAFGRNFFRIESAPAWLDPAEAEPFLRDILARLREGQLDPRRPAVAREELARLAAARAVRGAARSDTGTELAARLLACDQPLLTPGGRPTLIEIGRGELTRRFQKDRC
ncbi:MAG TPA: DNA mismatch repair endonuclease MutL [Opitutaceae bacterium]|nr:DNA mismatch repair endonuclease MutL [Opitutaceae bacterium]